MNNNHPGIHSHPTGEKIEKEFSTTGKILFECLHGNSNPLIITGRGHEQDITITLTQLQGIVSLLHDEFHDLGIGKGTNIMLVSFPSSSELYKTLYFITLVSMGARVFMPRKSSTEELNEWINKTGMQYALIPGKELMRHEGLEEDNTALLEMNEIFISRHVALLDTIASFPLDRIIQSGKYLYMEGNGGINQVYKQVNPEDETLILSFPGVNGASALKVYSQQEIVEQPIPAKLPISTLFRLMEEDELSAHKPSPHYL